MTSSRVVVVTGAGGAAGVPTVARLVDAGATVIACDYSADALAALVDSPLVHPVEVDLLDEQATAEWARSVVERFGRVDGLVHLVGGWRGGKGIVETDLADWDALHDSLIRTLMHSTRAFHDALVASGDGRLAIVSSTGVDKPRATNAVYATAKAATETWVRAVADSFARAVPKGADPSAAAVVFRVMALLTPAMRAQSPGKEFKGYTSVDDVAAALVSLWDKPADELNGQTISLKD